MSTRATYCVAMDAWVQDKASKLNHGSSGDYGAAVDRATERYSTDRPRIVYATLNGDGSTFDFAVSSLPAAKAWVDGLSRLIRVEYPYPPVTGQRDPNVVFDETQRNEPELVKICRRSDGTLAIRFLGETPVTGSGNIFVAYTRPHDVDDTTSTIPSQDEKAFLVLASSYACEMLASYYAQTKDAALSVDAVAWQSRSQAYADRAKALLKVYRQHIGAEQEGDYPAGSGIANWDVTLLSGRERLFRRRRLPRGSAGPGPLT